MLGAPDQRREGSKRTDLTQFTPGYSRAGLPGLTLASGGLARLVATAAENRGGVGWQMPKASAGRFTQPDLRFGFLAT